MKAASTPSRFSTSSFDGARRKTSAITIIKPGACSRAGLSRFVSRNRKVAPATFWNLSLPRAFVIEEEKHHDQ
jgi:hypothetical protein